MNEIEAQKEPSVLNEISCRLIAILLFGIILAFIFDMINPCGFTLLEVFQCQK